PGAGRRGRRSRSSCAPGIFPDGHPARPRRNDGSRGRERVGLRDGNREAETLARAGGVARAARRISPIGERARGLGMDCSRARELNLNGLRGRLSSEPAAELRGHLSTGGPGRAHVEAERVLSEVLDARLPQHAAPLALKRRLAASWPSSTLAAPTPRRFWGPRG